MNRAIKIFVYLFLFIICIMLILTGQKQQTLGYLFRMFAGLSGLIALLWIYNKNHR